MLPLKLQVLDGGVESGFDAASIALMTRRREVMW